MMIPPDPLQSSIGDAFTAMSNVTASTADTGFEAVFDGMQDIFLVATNDGRIIYANPAATRKLGYSAQELAAMRLIDLHPAHARAEAEQVLRAMLAGERTLCPLPFQSKCGAEIPTETRAWLGTWKGQECVFGMCRDLTAEGEANEDLRLFVSPPERDAAGHEIEELDGYFSLSLDLLCIASTDAKFIRLNPEWEKTLGYSVEELVGRCFLDFVHPDDHASTLQAVAKLNGREEVTGFENRYRHKDGSYRWLEWRSRPHGDRIYAVARDITRRKRIELALARSEERLRLALEATNDGVWELDLTTGVAEWSPRCYTMLGYTPGEFPVSFDSWCDKIHPDDREAAAGTIQERLRKGEAYAVEFRFPGKDGCWRWMLGRGKTVDWDGDGKPSRVIGTNTDIDTMKRAEAALTEARIEAEQANLAKSEFLANMSHELRTPLNSILGFSELMMQEVFGALGSPRYAEYVKDVHDSGRLLLEIINDILDLSRVEVGAVRLEEKLVDPKDVFLSLDRILRQRAVRQGVSFTTCVAPGTPCLVADPLRLKQILLNLASNAVKFTKSGGHVSVSSSVDEFGAVLMTVADTGIGMTAEDVTIALRPFGQVAAAQRRGHQGTGLGLPIAKSLAELHGATVEIQSAPKVGTTITVRFPPERSVPSDRAVAGMSPAAV